MACVSVVPLPVTGVERRFFLCSHGGAGCMSGKSVGDGSGARGRVCRLVAFLRHRGYCITVFISGFVVFLAPVKRCLFLAVLRGFLAF